MLHPNGQPSAAGDGSAKMWLKNLNSGVMCGLFWEYKMCCCILVEFSSCQDWRCRVPAQKDGINKDSDDSKLSLRVTRLRGFALF